MGLLHPDTAPPLSPLPCSTCFLWFPSLDLSGEAQGGRSFSRHHEALLLGLKL